MLDKTKDYGEVFGNHPFDVKYIQDGIEYLADGTPLEVEKTAEVEVDKPKRGRRKKRVLEQELTKPIEKTDWN